MHSPDRKPTALGYALLIYTTLVIAAITLIPFEFKIPGRIHINLHGSVSDVFANVVLFIPLGFLFQLARRRAGWRSLLQALGFGLLVSTAVEACQFFLPGRDSSLIDVATNGVGALLGAAAAAYQRASVRCEPHAVRQEPRRPHAGSLCVGLVFDRNTAGSCGLSCSRRPLCMVLSSIGCNWRPSGG